MHLLHNKIVEINVFPIQVQKQPLLIGCPLTKPKNDDYLPSNSFTRDFAIFVFERT